MVSRIIQKLFTNFDEISWVDDSFCDKEDTADLREVNRPEKVCMQVSKNVDLYRTLRRKTSNALKTMTL